MYIIPENKYENMDKESKRVIQIFKRIIDEEAYIFLDIKLFELQFDYVIVDPDKGIIFISKVTENFNNEIIVNFLSGLEHIEQIIIRKFKNERILNDNNDLVFNVKFLYWYSKLTFPNNTIQKYKQKLINNSLIEDLFNKRIDLFTYFKINQIKKLTEEQLQIINYFIAPYYYIPQKTKYVPKETRTNEKINSSKVDSNNITTKVYSLDSEQIDIINKINYGHRLILACAGSGKSAILLSKAIQFSLDNPKKKLLICCYNKNLRQFYEWNIARSPYQINNIECRTFHGLCSNQLKNNRIKFDYNRYGYDDLFDIVLKKSNTGELDLEEYDAIFIDEVQIFKKEWIKFCFNLLKDTKNPENYLFVLSGDKSQGVKNYLEENIAPWEINEEGYPIFNEDSIRIEKNYRNSIEINDYINSVTRNILDIYKKHNIEFDEDFYLRGKAFHKGNEPVIISTDRMKEAKEVVKYIKSLIDKGIDINDIAILFPQRYFSPQKYYILNWLEKELEANQIDYTIILQTENSNYDLANTNGVILSTIESSLGLDFENVILCGLYSLGFISSIYNFKQLKIMSNQQKEELVKNFNQIYTAITRAKYSLAIFVTQSEKENIYTNLLCKSLLGG